MHSALKTIMTQNPLKTSSYNFHLPDELIATHPVEPRDAARLLIYNRSDKSITHTYFYELDNYLPKETALIFNDTKVIKARLYGTKESGGKVELLINRPLNAFNVSVYIRGRVKVGHVINFEQEIDAKVLKLHEDGSREVAFYHNNKPLRFESLLPFLDSIGHIPLPPYMQREDDQQDSEDYQTVFAKHEGAVAAPTASLHFSDALFNKVCHNHAHAYVTLHVGAGTFKPVESDIITDHPMHSEYYALTPEAKAIIQSSQNLTCVGTTSTRTVEYYVRNGGDEGEANLFLHPNNKPQRVTNLITNFHLPQSTLLMLVASFVGLEETHKIYAEAIKEKYRFYSYGDAMLII